MAYNDCRLSRDFARKLKRISPSIFQTTIKFGTKHTLFVCARPTLICTPSPSHKHQRSQANLFKFLLNFVSESVARNFILPMASAQSSSPSEENTHLDECCGDIGKYCLGTHSTADSHWSRIKKQQRLT